MTHLEHIVAEMPMRCAVAELIGFCEGLYVCKKELLGEDLEARFRVTIDKAIKELFAGRLEP